MLTAPTNWNSLWETEDTVVEHRFTIDSKSYYNEDMSSSDCRVNHFLYDTYGIGNACIGRLTITLFDPDPIARGIRECTLAVRLKNGSTTTSWVNQGTWYLNTVEKSSNGLVKLSLMDGLALCDVYLYTNGVVPTNVSYPRAASTEIRAVCTKAGIPAPSDMSAFNGMQVTAPTNMTCRQILQSIAAMAGGNFIMAKDGKLKFMPLSDSRFASVAAQVSVTDVTQTSERVSVTGVSLRNKEETWTYGSDSSMMLAANCVYATQSVATNVYNKIGSSQYQGYKVSGAYLSPLVELGDYIEIEDTHERVFFDSYSVTYEQGLWGEFSSPLQDEVEQRIAYQNARQQQIDRLGELATNNAQLLQTMTTAEYISDLLDRINEQANETGGYTYIIEGQGIRTYDVAIEDLTDDSAAHSVVEIKGGTVRIANSRNSQGDWDWKTVFTSGHIAADLVTAANLTAGFIGSPSGNYWNLDTGELHMSSNLIADIAEEVGGDIEQTATAAATTAAVNAAKTEVEKIEVGSTNLLIDSNNSTLTKKAADANRSYSTNVGSSNITNTIANLSANSRPTGGAQYAFQAAFKASQSGKYSGICYYDGKAINFIDGQSYTVSCWAKRSGGTASVFFQYQQTSKKASEKMAITNKWKRYSFTFTFKQTDVGGSNGARMYFYCTPTSASATTVQIAGMKVEIGTKATDWAAAPEDVGYKITNAEAISKAYTDSISKSDRDYTAAQRRELDASFNQSKVFNRLTNNGASKGIYISNGQLYINANYIKTGTIDAGIVKTGIITDKKGYSKWNLTTGYFSTKNAELNNAIISGTLTTKASGNKMKVSDGGSLHFYNGNKNALTIDGSLKFQDGNYGAHITFAKYLVLRGPTLAVTNYTGRNGVTTYSGEVKLRDVTFNMSNNMRSCKCGDVILNFCNGLLVSVGGSSSLVRTSSKKW